LIPEVPVRIHQVSIAGKVPAVADVAPLPLVCQITAPSRALHRQASHLAARHRVAFLVEYAGTISRDRPACGAWPYSFTGGGNEDMEHFGCTDPVDQLHTGLLLPEQAGRQR